MERLHICYDFNFNIKIEAAKGRIYKRYFTSAIGRHYEAALWSLYFDLKKKRKKLISVNEVKVTRICFAFNEALASIKISLADYPPQIPGDLNAEVKHLPKKNNH
ncbi:hypothetical protein [Pedobacter sp. GR22-10]|uniref:hypothetical protein n=1 Tax=Pedobacter sp. GR22-10 TaxID=2994472 RepID=UPI002246CB2D|nr:hypothetical protein [Pedobacter sp. GR22-10]MCX2429874.1 hypothetical protein [Pedobacter sp. GR22-10]